MYASGAVEDRRFHGVSIITRVTAEKCLCPIKSGSISTDTAAGVSSSHHSFHEGPGGPDPATPAKDATWCCICHKNTATVGAFLCCNVTHLRTHNIKLTEEMFLCHSLSESSWCKTALFANTAVRSLHYYKVAAKAKSYNSSFTV